jgi:LPXTG-site transpeptidase (sortase) family protein
VVHRKYNRIAQKTFVIITVTLLSMCVTFILLYSLAPRYRAPLATASTENPAQASKPVVQNGVSVIAPPVSLKISKIGVDTTMAAVGVNLKGDMDIDENPTQAAWYKLGAKPGEEGSAVIAGHYGWKNGVPSVFNDLHTLVKGDKFSTIGEDGKQMMFVVTRLATYAPDQDATNVFRSDDGKAHLNLVTCQGSWNNSQSTYSERLVVFSDLVVQ